LAEHLDIRNQVASGLRAGRFEVGARICAVMEERKTYRGNYIQPSSHFLKQSPILEYTTVFNSGVKTLFCTSDLFVLPVQALALCLSYILLFSHSEVHDAHLSSILAYYSVSISSSLGFHLALHLHAPSLCAHG